MDDDFDPDGHDEEHEGIVVFDADAVVDPGAVMIKSLNTLITN